MKKKKECMLEECPVHPFSFSTGFSEFFLEDKASAPDVFSCCSFIPRPHIETSSVMFSCYGYEI